MLFERYGVTRLEAANNVLNKIVGGMHLDPAPAPIDPALNSSRASLALLSARSRGPWQSPIIIPNADIPNSFLCLRGMHIEIGLECY